MRILRWMTLVLALAAGTLGISAGRSQAAVVPGGATAVAGEAPIVSQARWHYRRYYYRPVRRYYRPYRRYRYYRPYRRYYARPYRRYGYYRPYRPYYHRRYYGRPRVYFGF
ncbi:hypothetical protein [uncultured Methylobacterium sp.]|jgi:hypothetical protein|uniref:hypothetical protein n=1 Tax=uncultured Methylobacterium sp. TaxID=157278 RepID=UPI00261B34E2|nr:hypothetical protein [uncultured Methylobacterium sp.]